MDAEIHTEEGPGVAPMVLEGIMYDFDERFILIGDESKTAFSLLSLNNVAKIDTVDEKMSQLLDPDKPKASEMN